MSFYWILGLIIFVLTFVSDFSKKNNRHLITLIFILLLVISSIRFNIGTDYYGHEQLYWAIKAGNYFVTEPLYLLLNLICIKLGLGFQSIIATMSFITLYPIYLISKKEKTAHLFLFYYFFMYLVSFCLIRQYAAISLVLYGVYIYSKNKTKCFGLFFCAICIHISMLIFIFSFLLGRLFKINKYLTFLLTCIFYLFGMKTNLFLRIIGFAASFTKYGTYLLAGNSNNVKVKLGSGLGVLLRIFISLCGLYIMNYNCKDKKIKSTYNFLFLCMIIADSLSLSIQIFLRLRLVFSACYLLPFIYFPNSNLKSKKSLSLSAVMYTFCLFCYVITFPSTASMWENLPYQTIF